MSLDRAQTLLEVAAVSYLGDITSVPGVQESEHVIRVPSS